jgi:hypothetical protein
MSVGPHYLKTAAFTITFADAYRLETNGIQPGVREDILRNSLNLEPALILALTKIRPRIEVRSVISSTGQNCINNW